MHTDLMAALYDGPLAADGWEAVVVFQALLAIADRRGRVPSAAAVQRRTGLPQEMLDDALAVLELRGYVVPTAEGYTIGAAHMRVRAATNRRAYHRQYARDHRGGPR